jgi:hypothetical protein
MDIAGITRDYLLYVIVPLWLAVGVADWLCHRKSRIETTTGAKESAIHLLMLAEVGAGILLALFFAINALVILAMFLLFLAHEATSFWDLRYATGRRAVSPVEQRVHDYLAVLPFMAFSFVLLLHWPAVAPLFGAGPGEADFSLRLAGPNAPVAYVAVMLTAVVLLELLPYGEELLRCLRARAAAQEKRP